MPVDITSSISISYSVFVFPLKRIHFPLKSTNIKGKTLRQLKVRIFISSKSVYESVCTKDSIYNFNHLCNIYDHGIGSCWICSNIISLHYVLRQYSCRRFAYRLSLFIAKEFIVILMRRLALWQDRVFYRSVGMDGTVIENTLSKRLVGFECLV